MADKKKENLKLATVLCRDPVPYEAAMDKTLSYQNGTLEFDEEAEMIIATNTKRGVATCIPLGNVVFFVPLEDKIVKADAERKAKMTTPAPVAPPRVLGSDVIKLKPE